MKLFIYSVINFNKIYIILNGIHNQRKFNEAITEKISIRAVNPP